MDYASIMCRVIGTYIKLDGVRRACKNSGEEEGLSCM